MEAPENRAMTAGLLKRLGLFPLDARHKDHPRCMCAGCLDGAEPERDELADRRKWRTPQRFPWENKAA